MWTFLGIIIFIISAIGVIVITPYAFAAFIYTLPYAIGFGILVLVIIGIFSLFDK
jgi:hypothetical protein